MLNIVQMNSQIYLIGYQSGGKKGGGLFLEEGFSIRRSVFHAWKIDRPDVLGLHLTVNVKRHVKYFLLVDRFHQNV